jgi:hypothetical protein
MDFDEERQTMEKTKLERTDAMFPDEIDTPMEVPARLRFKKYRGLESFRYVYLNFYTPYILSKIQYKIRNAVWIGYFLV